MKKLMMVLLPFVVSICSSAQTKFGIKAGMNASQLTTTVGARGMNSSTIPGLMFGGYINYSLSRVFGLQTELVLSQQGADMVYTASSLNDAEVKKWREQTRLNYINLPVLLEIKPLKKVPVGLLFGQQIGYSIYRSYEGTRLSINDDALIRLNKIDVATVFGIQYTSSDHLAIGIRYNIGMTKVIDYVDERDYPRYPYGENNVLQLSVGWTF